ncbi:hyalin-like [Anneissia japonica]|uniref:hyalin-like n=1 Tax=Anneissia japonica TaxID=1529436 RepID=UPI0014259929|nr:hyalin-like [Anneissia japonica]
MASVPGPALVSRYKSADQSSTDSPSSDYSADLAVDGFSSTCSQTMQQQNPYFWYVDLGDIYSVDYVLIIPENGNQASLIDSEVHVENVLAVPWGNNKCGSTITTSTVLSSFGFYQIDCNPSINGRYVFVYRSGTNNMKLTLCEVQVYGAVPVEPVVNCPTSFNTGTSPGQSTGTVTWNPPTVTDDIDTGLSATCTPSSGSSFNVGTNTITCTSTDSSGNTGSCTFTVTIRDNEPPSVTCPDDITVAALNQAIVAWDDPAVSDNVNTGLSATCTPPSGHSFIVGSNSVTCSAADAANNVGSCMFVVNVEVFVPEEPVVTCTGGVSVPTSPGQSTGIGTWSDPTVTDDIDTGLAATCTPPSGSSFPLGTNTVTCTATDSNGNVGSCTITVFVHDNESPNLTCPDDISMSTSSSQVTVTWNNPTVTDNVDTDLSTTCTPSSGSLFVLGSNDVTCDATDAAGRTGSCMFTVYIIEDTVNPSLICPSNIAMSTSSSQATVTWNDPTVSDNVDTGLSATCTPPSGSSFTIGSTIVTCSVTDVANNEDSCMFNVSVTGSSGQPTVICPDDINQLATVTWSDPVVRDNVDSGLSATCSPSSGSSFNVGETDVTCSAVDTDGNKASCSFSVNITGSTILRRIRKWSIPQG